jgi:Relaxase/Mobilisation nuclease domain
MMVTCDAAPELKRRGGSSPGGNKLKRPVYAISIEWHPDDKPSKKHMRETAHDVLKLLGLQDHQAVIVEHTDQPHAHIHLCVNLVHPETGLTNTLSKDGYKLDRWCDNYELRMGVIRSPDRRAKFAALDQGLDPPPPKKEPKRFQQPDLKPANENRTANQRAAAIKADQEAYGRRLKATQDGSWKRRKAQSDALWKDYRTSIQAIRDRHTEATEKIWKHKRNRNALPLSIQGFRDWKETREWTALMNRLKAEKRRFEYRERTLMGFLGNAIALVRPGMARTGNGYLSTLFTLLVSGQTRRELMLARQALAKKTLSEKQSGRRKVRADKLRHIRDAQLATLSAAYDIQKQALDLRHAEEIKNQKQEWRDLSARRDQLWGEWRAEFGIKERPRRQGDGGKTGDGDQGSAGDQGGGGKAPVPPIRKRPADQFANANKILTEKPKRAAESRVQKEFTPAAAPESDRPKAGWKQRKSAAERKLDGSYKPRQRKGLTPKM